MFDARISYSSNLAIKSSAQSSFSLVILLSWRRIKRLDAVLTIDWDKGRHPGNLSPGGCEVGCKLQALGLLQMLGSISGPKINVATRVVWVGQGLGARRVRVGGEGAAVQLGARRRVRAQVIDGPHCGPPRRAASSLLPPARPVCARPSRLRPGRAPAPGSWPSSPRLRPKGKSLLVH